jgi:hypothetical protein
LYTGVISINSGTSSNRFQLLQRCDGERGGIPTLCSVPLTVHAGPFVYFLLTSAEHKRPSPTVAAHRDYRGKSISMIAR